MQLPLKEGSWSTLLASSIEFIIYNLFTSYYILNVVNIMSIMSTHLLALFVALAFIVLVLVSGLESGWAGCS